MLKYESRYRLKGASVYGEPYLKIIDRICNDNRENFSILIPNCLDGIDVIPFLKRGAIVDCYEENRCLLSGGTIDNFKSVGLKNRIRGINRLDKCNVFEDNFYLIHTTKKYDVVFVSSTLHFKTNDRTSLVGKLVN